MALPDLERVRKAFDETRSVEETAKRLGVNLPIAHRLILQITKGKPIRRERGN